MYVMTILFNCASRKYCASVNLGDRIIDFWEDADYNTLKKAVEDITGIRIPDRKRVKFERLSADEKIATLSSAGAVSLDDIRKGWRPNMSYDYAMVVM